MTPYMADLHGTHDSSYAVGHLPKELLAPTADETPQPSRDWTPSHGPSLPSHSLLTHLLAPDVTRHTRHTQ